MTKANFYVYFHRDTKTSKVFYIGKGTRERATSLQNRSKAWKQFTEKNTYSVEIYKSGLTSEEALTIEAELISSGDFTNLINSQLNSRTKELNLDLMQDWFYYDEESPSCLRWRRAPLGQRIRAGDDVKSIGKSSGKSYFVVKLLNSSYKVHRIIYLLKTGSLHSSKLIDHIDGDGLNNSFSNLRETTSSTNARNRPLSLLSNIYFETSNDKGTLRQRYKVRWTDSENVRRRKDFCVTATRTKDQALELAINFRDLLVNSGVIQGRKYGFIQS